MLLTPQEIAVSEESAEAPGAESEQSTEVAQAFAPTLSEVSVVSVEVEPDLVSDIQLEAVNDVPTAQTIDATVVMKGAMGVGTTGASGAVDHLTAEIAAALAQRPTLVCWVFDRSVSSRPNGSRSPDAWSGCSMNSALIDQPPTAPI